MAHSMRKEYGEHGVVGFYEKFGKTYRNKHFPEIKRMMRALVPQLPAELRLSASSLRVLDLACGSGEATLALVDAKVAITENVDGCDPYTFEAFEDVVGKACLRWSFEDIADGVLDERKYDLCICSFALHLLDTTKLLGVCYQLSTSCRYLLVLTPHKKPEIKASMGWELELDTCWERIHCKLYKSTGFDV